MCCLSKLYLMFRYQNVFGFAIIYLLICTYIEKYRVVYLLRFLFFLALVYLFLFKSVVYGWYSELDKMHCKVNI